MTTKRELEHDLADLRRREKAYSDALHDANASLRDRVTELSILCRLGEVLRIDLDLPAVCARVVDVLLQEIEADNCSLFMVDESGESLRLVAAKGRADAETRFFPLDERPPTSFSMGEGVIGQAALRRTGILIEDAMSEKVFTFRAEQRVRIRSLLCVPLVDRDETIGVLNLSHPEPGAFRDSERRLLTIASGQTAVAVKNVELVGRLKALNRQLEDRVHERTASLEQARQNLQRAWAQLDAEVSSVGEIQRAMLPAGFPRRAGVSFASHYTPASRAGGDYYDFLELPGGRLGIALADVSGHGTPAAVVMAMTRSVLRSCAAEETSPAEVLRVLNHYLARQIPTQQYVTMLYGVLSRSNRTFTFSSAGHCPPAVLSRAGDVREYAQEEGFPLCFFPDSRYEETSVRFRAGDRIVLYTDGLVEAFDGQGASFGMDRFEQVLRLGNADPAARLVSRLTAAVDGFRGDRPLHDDVTVVVLESSLE